jgi:phosphoenolpyruvate---glycerone phosphotransferase subunit DhaL
MADGSPDVDTDTLRRWLRAFAASVAEHKEELTALDAAIGDADHGANMDRGMTAVVEALEAAPSDPAALFKQTGMTLVKSVGGASGPLYGTLFLRMAPATGGAATLDPETFAKALRAGLEGVVARGKAAVGEKTMVDALAPALDALDTALGSGKSLAEALRAASAAADEGRDGTTPIVARKGRASYLGERSAGHQDPGATSAALLVAAAASAVAEQAPP